MNGSFESKLLPMEKKTVLVCPMDWGLGHASRCIPVIRAFSKEGCRVVVASSGPGTELIRQELDMTRDDIIPFPGFEVSYSRSFLFARLAVQMPEFIYHVTKEKKALKDLVDKIKPDLIVSDNRYGLVHDSVPSVLITHQLQPSLPFYFRPFERLLSAVIRKWAGSFNECWIPDFPDNSAAGALINGWSRLPHVYFTGWLSRFTSLPDMARENKDNYETTVTGNKRSAPAEKNDQKGSFARQKRRYRYRIIFILSGPEPQRGMLEGMITEGCIKTGISALVVRGLPGLPMKKEVRGQMEIVSFLGSDALLRAVSESEIVVCRSGYSSVMDMLVLGKKAVLIPTPGQTEQEYLGKWLAGRHWFDVVDQKSFSIDRILETAFAGGDFPAGPDPMQNDLLEIRVKALISDPGSFSPPRRHLKPV
jgi:hypothetical protein